MKNTCLDNLYFGDLHFHTHYSDNRDYASIEEMILEGAKYHLSIFGTADHNHDLDAKRWRQTLEETERLKPKYPEFVLMNNCEITFLIGHFNILIPEHIEGTIAEGYRYLYLDSNVLKIINHPFAFNDEWYKRIIPDAIGLEVINGSMFNHAKEDGYRIHSAIDIPSVHTYATYLALNIPVAAIGSSDAHRKAEVGYGMTGFWLADKPDILSVLEAIKEGRTFATTRSDIIIEWVFNEADYTISWNIDWKKKNSSPKNDFTVEIYHGPQKIQTTCGEGGKLAVEKEGLYWIAVFDEGDIAISSPIPMRGKKFSARNPAQGEEIATEAIHLIRKDLTWLNMEKTHLSSPKMCHTLPKYVTHYPSQPESVVFNQDVEIPVISGAEYPQIVDANGTKVLYEVLKRGSSRVIIDKTCGEWDFEEFYLWFSRNEIHEYVFAKIEYHKVNQTFFFNGHLLPKKMAHQEDIATRYIDEIDKIRKIVDEQTRFKIYVSTLPSLVLKIHLDSRLFPYKIFDDFTGFSSVLFYVEEDVACPVHMLDRFKGFQYDESPLRSEKIYQIFV